MQAGFNKISGKINWRSPSNIALVKYWGKKPVQLPANPSLSMTLSKACTEMEFEFSPRDGNSHFLEFYFEGKKNEKFAAKIEAYLHSLAPDYPFLEDYCFRIYTTNSFPHSTGIASSASSMSALGLCLADFFAKHRGEDISLREASRLSRLASGSACRSVYGGYTIWGYHGQIEGSSDDYAIPLPFGVHPVFSDMRDSILIVSSKEKDISSRAGHALMDTHPYAEKRYEIANCNAAALALALNSGDIDEFIRITESEALNLHALMMTSPESYMLLQPGTLNLIIAIRQFRKENSIPVCFTLDAGPNIHLLYPGEYAEKIKEWINSELVEFCENGKWIDDKNGKGPKRI
jgi:diphosphomevalonate decarboxylase